MLPFLKNKLEGSASMPAEPIKRKPDEESDYDDAGLHAAAEDLMHAVHAKDIKGIAVALKAAFEICDEAPHVEGEHINE